MSNKFTLADIISAAEEKYGDTVIDEIVLVNPLRMSSEKRKALMALQSESNELKEADAEEADQLETLAGMIRLIAETDKMADDLLESVGDRLDVLAVILEKYGKSSQMGEA